MCAAGSNHRAAIHHAGMTLLELLVVLVIAALMLALVAPNIGKVLPGAEFKGFALQSAALLRELRSEALTRSERRSLELVVDEGWYSIDGSPRLAWPEDVEVELDVRDLPGRESLTPDNPQLIFYPDGSSNGGVLSMSQSDGDQYRIRVEAFTGRVTIDG
ncbi:GspH/FimT family pseudopilin [Marinobacterium sediminicola]|uniref:Type II secretion system protein H n=1 Tax=Marinobacterium sediminicola TaxID=518898 RepID=A0ABY1S4R7_9GAMM|nr:GspH/FimT family pseudopilin [Marinobacterium sediminicola]ULG68428.1 GspH/FimT family pseudopilin [Marinobacterium sediminicola]SMR78506.1 general secretion pathway protein H [Marinobacterium sediminicola]